MTLLRLRSLPWVLALVAVGFIGVFSYANGRSYLRGQAAVREALASREVLTETLPLLKDAETGGRGFLLTGDERFLEPYETARPQIQADLTTLDRLGEADPSQRGGVVRVALLVRLKLGLLNDLIVRKRHDKALGADAVPKLEEGKAIMDAIRGEIAQMLLRADARVEERERSMRAATLDLQLVLGAGLLGGVLLALAVIATARRDAQQARLAAEQLAHQTQLLESVLANIGDAVLVVDDARKVVLMNPAHARIVPYRPGATLATEWSEQVQTYLPDGKTPFPPELGPLTRALRGDPSDDVEMLIRVPNGEVRSYTVTTRPIASDGNTIAAVAVFRDTTEMKRAAKDLLENEQRYRILSEASFEGVAITREGRIQDSNANFARWLGYEPSELVGMPAITLFPAEERDRVRALSVTNDVSYESRMMRRDGTVFPVEVHGRMASFRNETVRIAVVRDVTEKKEREAQLLEKTERLRGLSLRDELTGLHNRRGFVEAAEQKLKTAARNLEPCAIFFADMNGMKVINDQLGHEAGDQAIRAAAEVLKSAFRPVDVVARLGGDEFAILAGNCDESGVSAAYLRIENAVSALNSVSVSRFRLSISAGATVRGPHDPRDLASLIQAADANMYEAKRIRHERASLRVRSG